MLTKTEQKVYEKAMLGFNATEMAAMFQRHPQNIQKRMTRMYRKFGVNSIQKLMALRIAELENKLHANGIDYD